MKLVVCVCVCLVGKISGGILKMPREHCPVIFRVNSARATGYLHGPWMCKFSAQGST